MPLGKRVVIVGGGLIGLELAQFLLARGPKLTVLEPALRLLVYLTGTYGSTSVAVIA